MEHKSVCLCCEFDGKTGMLPDKEDAWEILLGYLTTCACVKPTTCCKGTCRVNFTNYKFAIPCDEEVPFSCACLGIVCCGDNNSRFKAPTYFKSVDEIKGDMKQVEMGENAGGPECSEMSR